MRQIHTSIQVVIDCGARMVYVVLLLFTGILGCVVGNVRAIIEWIYSVITDTRIQLTYFVDVQVFNSVFIAKYVVGIVIQLVLVVQFGFWFVNVTVLNLVQVESGGEECCFYAVDALILLKDVLEHTNQN